MESCTPRHVAREVSYLEIVGIHRDVKNRMFREQRGGGGRVVVVAVVAVADQRTMEGGEDDESATVRPLMCRRLHRFEDDDCNRYSLQAMIPRSPVLVNVSFCLHREKWSEL